MSDAAPPPTRADGVVIGAGPAIGAWAFGWVFGLALLSPLVLLAFGVEGDDYTIPQLGVAMIAGWSVFAVALWFVSRRSGTGDVMADYAVSFRPVDLLALPVGVLGQLVLVPLLYVPLRELWPTTFSQSELEDRAQDLADKAGGFDTVLLVILVAFGAPIIEELVYRGLLQRSIGRSIGVVPAFVLVSLGFALVHFAPVEYPGLFLAGLLFGAGVVITGRIGPSILAHMAFNATGLVLVLA